jgi:hypothetical protein
MKLLLCKNCQDVIRLQVNIKRTCKCGNVSGIYLDDLNAIYSGDDAVPIGFANSTLVEAIRNQPEEGMGKVFTAFVIPKNCYTFEKVERIDE